MWIPSWLGVECGTNKAPLSGKVGALAGPGCGCLAPGGEAADVPTAPPRPCVQRYWLTGAPPGVRRRWRENAGGGERLSRLAVLRLWNFERRHLFFCEPKRSC